MSYECMYDCIHLHACRRIQYIARKRHIVIPHFCENCNCYVSGDTGKYVTAEEAVEYARDGVDDIRDGYNSYCVYATQDLRSKTISEIIEEAEMENN